MRLLPHVIAAALLITAIPTSGASNEDYVVPAGEVWRIDGSLDVSARNILIDGVILMEESGDVMLVASEAIVVSGKIIVRQALGTSDAEIHSGDVATILGADGNDGGDIVLVAPRITLGPDAILAAGNAADGVTVRILGEAHPEAALLAAWAGSGGRGGGIVLMAQEIVQGGKLLPGLGGAGGIATADGRVTHNPAPDAHAIGGDAGAMGIVNINSDSGSAVTAEEEFLVGMPGGDALAYSEVAVAENSAACGGANGVDGPSASETGADGSGGNPGSPAKATGSDGTEGMRGCDGTGQGSDGGAGGRGGGGGAATARGGRGGNGFCNGGKGGSGNAYGGSGGRGGMGGTGDIGTPGADGTPFNLNGGNGGTGKRGGIGGAGGPGGVSQAFGGAGGTGTTCTGGDGGSVYSISGRGGNGYFGGTGGPGGRAGCGFLLILGSDGNPGAGGAGGTGGARGTPGNAYATPGLGGTGLFGSGRAGSTFYQSGGFGNAGTNGQSGAAGTACP